MEQLTSALNKELLNSAEVTPEFTATSVAEMLCEKMFGGGVSDISNPRFLALTNHLACSTKQQVAFRLQSPKDLGDSLREMLLMVRHLAFLTRIFVN